MLRGDKAKGRQYLKEFKLKQLKDRVFEYPVDDLKSHN